MNYKHELSQGLEIKTIIIIMNVAYALWIMIMIFTVMMKLLEVIGLYSPAGNVKIFRVNGGDHISMSLRS